MLTSRRKKAVPINIDARSSYGIMLCARCGMNEFVCVSISISNSRIYSSEILASARNGQTNKLTQSAHASTSDVIVVTPACACEPIEEEAKTFRMMENRETCFPMQMDPFHAPVSCKIHNRFLLLVCHFCCFIVMFVYISADCELLAERHRMDASLDVIYVCCHSLGTPVPINIFERVGDARISKVLATNWNKLARVGGALTRMFLSVVQ